LMVDRFYPEVVKEAGIKPSGPGALDDVKIEDSVIFFFTIPLEPTVELGNLDDLKELMNHQQSPRKMSKELFSQRDATQAPLFRLTLQRKKAI